MAEWAGSFFGSITANHIAIYVAIGSAIWQLIEFNYNKTRARMLDEYAQYHETVERIVSPPKNKASGNESRPYINSQMAAIYELRHFPRYYNVSERIISVLINDEKWKAYDHLIKELKFSLEYISSNNNSKENK